MIYRALFFFVVLSHLVLTQACAPAVVAGAATGVVVASDRRTAGAFLDDQTIELKAKSAIAEDKALNVDTHINYTSMNGILLLTGEAKTAADRDQVLAKVRTVQGIRRIVNEIRIAPNSSFGSRSHDSWITTKVKGRMVSAENLEASRVKVVTENQVVYLLGLVKKQEADVATDVARNIKGVERVVKLFEYID